MPHVISFLKSALDTNVHIVVITKSFILNQTVSSSSLFLMFSSIQTLIEELMKKKKLNFHNNSHYFPSTRENCLHAAPVIFMPWQYWGAILIRFLGMSQHRMCSFQSLRKCALLLNVLALFLILLVVVWLVSYCPTPFQELVWHLAHWLKLSSLFDNVCLVK